ncbi:MAG: Cache 3/Cache 2 fusion domain-containing protein, partial [Bacteroidales bacterium]|nr:Cache 3/Cache 2 fusion domain-containing protein [Bacteroidales bacterium]
IEVSTISRMFERERTLKFDNVSRDLKILHALFYQDPMRISPGSEKLEVTNQITHQRFTEEIHLWYLNGAVLNGNNSFVDRVHTLTESTVTIFQKIDSGFVRIATNVLNDQGERALWTYIPNDSPVVKTVEQGIPYYGRAYVVNDWYITAYEPIVYHNRVVGMLYVGDQEKDLAELRTILNQVRIGRTGYVFAFDENGINIIHPSFQGDKIPAGLLKTVEEKPSGLIEVSHSGNIPAELVAFTYFPDFKLYICAAIDPAAESRELITGIIRNAIIIAVITILLFSAFIYLLTKKNLYKYLRQIEQTDKKLTFAREALERSEEKFRTFFNHSSDEIFIGDFDGFILEVNQVTCDDLGYLREELIGKHFRELKSEKYLGDVQKNLEMIRHFGQYRYETENVTKSGEIIPVEMKSRVIEYNGEKRILSIARDITERKEIEERILKAIISTEESERQRFAADLHDDLGPILSTIKLYTDVLKKGDHKNIDRAETVKNINELIDMAIRTSREISNRIRPNVLQDFGLAAAITEFCSFINQSGSLKISLQTDHYSVGKRGIEESILFQVTKELINNTLRHADATNVLIDLKSIGNQIILYYRDDGSGFDLETAMKNRSGLGLYNILNKVKTINGTCDLNTTKGKGMFMTISVKLKND